MKWFSFSSFIAGLIYTQFAFGAPLNERGWLAFGDLRGYVEPCGCDPTADLGGIQRQAVFLQKERAISPKLFLFILGNNLPVTPSPESYKVSVLLDAMQSFKPDAILFNRLELQWYKEYAGKYKSVPYVVANLIQPENYKYVTKHLHKNNLFITGYVTPAGDLKARFRDLDEALLEGWRNEAKKSTQSILLFNGSNAELERIHRSKVFDLIISSNQRPLDDVVGPEEKNNEKLLNRGGGVARMVPVGGQGVLRGGVLLQQKAKSLAELLGPAECDSTLTLGCGVSRLSTREQDNKHESTTWLTREYALPSFVDHLYENYQKASRKAFSEKAKDRLAALKDSPFAGSEQCKSCHAEEYRIWQKSNHARALETLVTVGQDRNPECVTCHVLGYEQAGGFVDSKHSPQFANVTCENCHGPRKDHIKNPSVKHPSFGKAREVCVSCHHGTHTSNFIFEEYWQAIKH